MLHGRKILIVDDDAVLAFDWAQNLIDAGAKVQVASTLRQAMAVIDCDWSAAIIDHELGTETADDLYVELKSRAVPFIIVTGHAPCLVLMPDTLIFTKPVLLQRVIRVLAAMT